MSPSTGGPPDALFVVGSHESGLGSIADQFRRLGLGPVLKTGEGPVLPPRQEALASLNDQLLADLGGEWRQPALHPQLELWRRLSHRQELARQVFDDACEEAAGAAPGPWVWADPRNSILAPFWIRALGVSASTVLVHRHPASAAEDLSAGHDLPVEQALALWDEYNRMALNLFEDAPGIVIGIEAFGDDVKKGVRALQGYLEGLGVRPTGDQVASAISAFEECAGQYHAPVAVDIPNRYLVLDRLLADADQMSVLDPSTFVDELANYYDEEYYAHYGTEADAPYRRGEAQWSEFFSMLATRIDQEIQPDSVLDAGCAIGMLVEALRDRGVDAFGIDVSDWAISQVPDSIRPYCSVGSLTQEISGHFDLVTLVEVIEHLPDSVAGPVIANITRHAEAVLFSSTSEGFEEPTHLNVRTPDHWARLFAVHGFFRDFAYDAGYLSKDAVLFRRSSPDPSALVVGYEQTVWRNREHLQGILDQVVPERDALVSKVGEYAERAGELEHQTRSMGIELDTRASRIGELEQRRAAEAVAIQAELQRRDWDTAELHGELQSTRGEAAGLAAQVSAIEATKVFRYSARLRRVYGRLRGRGAPGPSSTVALSAPAGPEPRISYQEWSARYDTVHDGDRKEIRFRMNAIVDPPVISVILPVFNTPEGYLREAIDSVRSQLYPHWELCIVDDCSTEPHVREIVEAYEQLDRRIKVVYRQANGHISAASNSGLELSTGRWVALLDHDDRLREHALALMAIEADRHPDAGLLYSDENIVDAAGALLKDYCKPDFDPLLLLGMNHICHLAVIRRDLMVEVGGFREGFEGSQDWDLLLRVTGRLRDDQVRHVPHILYDWRSHPASTAQSLAAKPYAATAGLRAVQEHLARGGDSAQVIPIPALGWNRVKWDVPDPAPLVSIIIPTRDGPWLERCLQSIWTFTTYPNYEIVVVDNGSVTSRTLEFLRLHQGRLQVLRDERPFSYSGLNNAAVGRVRGPLLCLLNDDTEVISPDWLDEMVGQVLRPQVGAVGAKLLYDDGTVQHAGVALGIGGVGGHVHRGLNRLDIGYFGRAVCAQHFSAVTGACMVVRREAWDQVGGLDDEQLSIGYNDVDFCLRLKEAGWRTVWTPSAELIHHESLTRGPDVEGPNAERLARETRYMQERWGTALRTDPAYNPNLSLAYEDFSLACPPRLGYLGEESGHQLR